ncbi:MAG: SusD/RagB family nutrient-binding outer membrane lipoprotein [Ferruginibacter sp.]
MKKILYSFFLLAAVGSVVSCRKNISDLNNNPTRPSAVTSASLFSNASVNLADVMASTNVNNNNFRLFVQYWTETIYRDETRYNLNGRSITDRWFATFYRDVISDLTEASRVVDNETLLLNPTQIKNRKAIDEMLIVYSYYTLLTSFGNIPYDEALDINNLQPQYQDAAQVFDKLTVRLDAALTALDVSGAGYGSSDLILKDDLAGWKRFGNSLKMRMGILVVDVNPAKAQTMIVAAAPNVISSNAENISMEYLSAPPNTNPVWEDLIQSGRHDFVAAKPFIDTLKKYNDPRLPKFFNPSITDGTLYIGQAPGAGATFNDFSAPASSISSPEAPFTFFSYAEMELYKAEAVARGIAVGGTPEQHYKNGVYASIDEWGGTMAQADAYYAMPSVNYLTATGTFKQKIGLQSWITLYNRGYDAWTQMRRLDYPILPVPSGSASYFSDGETPAIITRLTYPVVEQNLNKKSYDAAAAAIGKDWKTQKLWFDKF